MSEDTTEPVRNSSELSARFGTVKEASSELGISERAVIKRITTGAMEAIREGKQWRVRLPDLPDGPNASTGGTEPVRNFAEPTEPSAEPGPNAKDALIEALTADVEFLRSQLQQRDVAESELRRLMLADKHELSRLQQENRLLLAAPGEEPTPEASPVTLRDTQDALQATAGQEVPQKERRAWWQVWKRF